MASSPVIGIVGLQASGKTEVANKMIELGASRVRMGDVVWKEVKERGLEVSEEKVGEVANELRQEGGPAAIAEKCIPLINEEIDESEAVVVDGIRSDAEVEVFEDNFGEDFYLISVEASEKTRFNRIESRNREDDIADWDNFKKKDERELGWGMGEAMEMADYQMINEENLEDLQDKAKVIFEEITGQ
ncbi:MAG: flagellar hook-basal body complex protein FliE [Hadesarchaea archaeon]|nr:flagellar hook-basal body complex protein FliE [Hadesarchaea archaeon]